MSSWLDPYLDSLAKTLGLKKPSIDDAMRQDPGAQAEVNRFMNAGRAQNTAQGIKEIPHWSEAIQGPKMGANVVNLPPIQMEREAPAELPPRADTPYDIQRRQQPAPKFNHDLLSQLIAAETQAGVSQPTYGRGDGKGNELFYSPQQGRDMDENEARAYLELLEGR